MSQNGEEILKQHWLLILCASVSILGICHAHNMWYFSQSSTISWIVCEICGQSSCRFLVVKWPSERRYSSIFCTTLSVPTDGHPLLSSLRIFVLLRLKFHTYFLEFHGVFKLLACLCQVGHVLRSANHSPFSPRFSSMVAPCFSMYSSRWRTSLHRMLWSNRPLIEVVSRVHSYYCKILWFNVQF